jgi:hypothetical protein
LFIFFYEKLNFQHESKQMKLNDRVFLRVSFESLFVPHPKLPPLSGQSLLLSHKVWSTPKAFPYFFNLSPLSGSLL